MRKTKLIVTVALVAMHLVITTPARAAVVYGSGFFVHPGGYLLTNYHVVSGAQEIVVMTADGSRYEATIVKFDDAKDLALLRMPAENQPFLKLAKSADVEVLQSIISLGFPYADKVGLELSAYEGRINAIRESGRFPLFQIDANMNPGSSGGPVLNAAGQVVTVAVAKVNAVKTLLEDGEIPERMNFAIPIDEARGVLSAAFPMGYSPENEGTPSDANTIFKSAKPAVALVVARSKPEVPVKPATPVEKPASLDLASGIESAIARFVRCSNSDSKDWDPETLFADKIDYFEHGVVSVTFARSDFLEYRQRWPYRQYSDPTFAWVDVKTTPGVAHVRYSVDFEVRNKERTITGKSEVTLSLSYRKGATGIVSIKETVSDRKVIKHAR